LAYLGTSGKVCSGGSEVAPSSSIYCTYTNSCTDGACSGTRYWQGCAVGTVTCTSTGQTSTTINASTGYSLTSTCGTTGTTPCRASAGVCDLAEMCAAGGACAADSFRPTTYVCGYSAYNGCSGACQKKRDVYKCNGNIATCDTGDDGDDLAYLGTSGKVCSGGSEVAPTSTNKCDGTINCATNACSAATYYRGCVAGAATCTDEFHVTGTSWSASDGYVINQTTYKVGTSCTQAVPTTSLYCNTSLANNNNCQYTTYYRACGGTGSCRTDNTGAASAQATCGPGYATKGATACAAVTTSNYCSASTNACNGVCMKRTNYYGCNSSGSTCEATSRATSDAYCAAGYYCDIDYLLCCGGNCASGACGYSAWNGCNGACQKKRDVYKCTGTSATCPTTDQGDNFANCAPGTYCSTNSCTSGYCNTTSVCRDGSGWHHICNQDCDNEGTCSSWVNCSDHCFNSVQDCDETGIDSGGSCTATEVTNSSDQAVSTIALRFTNVTYPASDKVIGSETKSVFISDGAIVQLESSGYLVWGTRLTFSGTGKLILNGGAAARKGVQMSNNKYARICMPDSDNDNYWNKTAMAGVLPNSTINDTCPNGYKHLDTANFVGGDCYDNNANVHPDQTAYFNVPTGLLGSPANFDYNCDGSIQYKYDEIIVDQCYNIAYGTWVVGRIGDTEYTRDCSYNFCGIKYNGTNWYEHLGSGGEGADSGCKEPFTTIDTPTSRAAYRH